MTCEGSPLASLLRAPCCDALEVRLALRLEGLEDAACSEGVGGLRVLGGARGAAASGTGAGLDSRLAMFMGLLARSGAAGATADSVLVV